jgi:hypothetical protein
MPIGLHIHKLKLCKILRNAGQPVSVSEANCAISIAKHSSLDLYNEFKIRPTTYWKNRKLMDCSGYSCIIISAIYFTPLTL